MHMKNLTYSAHLLYSRRMEYYEHAETVESASTEGFGVDAHSGETCVMRVQDGSKMRNLLAHVMGVLVSSLPLFRSAVMLCYALRSLLLF